MNTYLIKYSCKDWDGYRHWWATTSILIKASDATEAWGEAYRKIEASDVKILDITLIESGGTITHSEEQIKEIEKHLRELCGYLCKHSTYFSAEGGYMRVLIEDFIQENLKGGKDAR